MLIIRKSFNIGTLLNKHMFRKQRRHFEPISKRELRFLNDTDEVQKSSIKPVENDEKVLYKNAKRQNNTKHRLPFDDKIGHKVKKDGHDRGEIYSFEEAKSLRRFRWTNLSLRATLNIYSSVLAEKRCHLDQLTHEAKTRRNVLTLSDRFTSGSEHISQRSTRTTPTEQIMNVVVRKDFPLNQRKKIP